MRQISFFRASGAALSLAMLASGVSLAQTITATITGTVTDPSGAVIPKAQVTVVNSGTGVRTQATSNGAGVYSVRFLPIGSYSVEVTAPGFTQVNIPQFALEINQTAKIDAHLQVGASTEVKVQGSLAPILNTTDGTLGLSLDANEIATIPLNGRNFSSVTLFQPGAVDTDPTGLTSNNAIQRNTFNSGVVTINGNRAQANNYTLDGIDINETQNNLIGYAPSPDALQEVRVISANAPASYGNVNGGDIVSVLKSGTNKFHGSAFENIENQNITANGFTNNFNGVNQRPFTQSIFGGTLGGPILHDKLFFFVDYTGTRRHDGGTATASVLTAAQRQGDFSTLLAQKTPIQLVDTANGFTPYANDRGIPIVNPVARFLFANPQYYPLPNRPATRGIPTDGLIQNNYLGPNSSFVTNNQGDVKIEWDPRSQDKVTAFYSQGIANGGSTAPLAITFPQSNTYPDHLGGATWVHTISPSVVNEVRFGFTRIRWDSNIPTDPSGAFGLNGNSIVGLPSAAPQQYVGFTYQNVSNNFSGIGSPGSPQVLRDNTYSANDLLTIQRGRHLITLGGNLLRYQQNFTLFGNGGQLGTYSFSGQYSTLPGDSGYGPVDFLLDRANQQQISLSNGFVGQRQYRIAGFAQDDWKVSDRLTLNLGLRYEYDQPYAEVNSQTANVLLTGPRAGTVEYANRIPAGAPAGSSVCSNPGCYDANYTQFQPRIGFAFQANPRVVFRGGYGTTSFLEGNPSNERLANNPPFTSFSQLQGTSPTAGSGGSFFAETNGFAISGGSLTNPGYTASPQNIQPALLQEFNFNTQIELNNSTSAQFGYVGELGRRLADFRNGNQLTIAQVTQLTALGLNNQTPLAQIPVNLRAPFAGLVGQGNNLFVIEAEGVSSYNALQVTVRHRVSRGFQATVNYTWAKSLTDANGNFGASNSAGPNAVQDGYNLHGDYGPSELDVRNNLSANGSYAIPYGRGQLYGANSNKVVDLLAGGWTFSSTAIAYSGLPVTIFSPANNNTNSFGNQFGGSRANQYRKLRIVNRSVQHFFGTDPSATPCSGADNGLCAYGVQPVNSFGTARVGTERSPGFDQIDSSLFKQFHLVEGQSVGFRADGFNIFNFSAYGNPGNDSGNAPSFGQITSARSGPRTFQFAATYTF